MTLITLQNHHIILERHSFDKIHTIPHLENSNHLNVLPYINQAEKNDKIIQSIKTISPRHRDAQTNSINCKIQL